MSSADPHEELQARLGGYYAGALTANMVELGDRLGLFKGLAAVGPCTPGALAAHLDLATRYIEEWCRQQASAGVISHADGTFWLTEVQQDVLVREHGPEQSPFFAVGGFQALPGLNEIAGKKLAGLFRSGEGFDYDSYPMEVTCGTFRELGVWVRHNLVNRLRSIPDMETKLEGGCVVADVGCGCGEAVLAAAAAFPSSTFHGFDVSEKALAHARATAAERGVHNVEFINPGLDEVGMGEGVYDLVMTHDAIHDMATPGPVMASVHKAMKPGAMWALGDMSAMESHSQNITDHPLAAFMYGFSCHLCLPSALSAPQPAGLGTLGLSTSLAKSMLAEAGFQKTEVVDWGHPLNRYYLVTA